MNTTDWGAIEPADNWTDPDDLTDEEVVEDHFDEDAWDDIAREDW